MSVGDDMKKDFCGECRHFRQHYILDESRAAAVNCGHCVLARRRHRAADAAACDRFVKGEHVRPDREAVLHFLTTDMLAYILSLPLPPEEDKP